MFFIKLFLMCSEHYFAFFLVLIVLACFLSRVYISSYLRMCYFVSKIRGPRAYPIVGNITLLIGSLEESTKNLLNVADKYSPVGRMWLGPVPLLFTKEPRLVQELLTNHELLEKADIMKRIGGLLMGDSIITSEVPKWKHNRNIIIKGFSPIILKSYFKIFTEKIHILTEKLDIELSKGKCFDIFEYLSRTTLDSVCGSTMGVNVGAQDLNSSYFNAMQSSLYLMTQRALNPLLHSELIYRSTQSYKQLRRNENIVKGLTKQIVLEKKNDNNAVNNNYKFTFTDIKRNEYKKPLLEYLLDFSRSNSSFTEKQLEVETNLVIVAAYETTANALSYVILSLAANKNIQNKVYEEVFNVLNESKREKIDFDDLSKLKYMEMVIKESMRLHATAPFIARKVSQDIHFDNCIIPKGVDVIISIFGLHRNPNVWENPLKFDPERFAHKNIKNCHPYAYIPFSSGARNCIGMRYAWIFMKTALATLLSRYEFHTDLKLDKLRFEFEVSLKLIGGHQVRITPRQKCTK